MSCEEGIDSGIWTTKEGTKIAYHDLENTHLVSIIRTLNRESLEISLLPMPTADMASLACEQDLTSYGMIIDDLLEESDRRDIDRRIALGFA